VDEESRTLIDLGKRNLLGVGIDAVDYEGATRRIVQAASAEQKCSTTALAVHGVMTGFFDDEYRYRLNQLDLVVPDGQPVRWALNLLHRTGLPDRVYGPNLTLEVCRVVSGMGLPVFFYGSRPEVVEKLAVNLQRRFPGLVIAGVQPSLFRRLTVEEKDRTIKAIKKSGAALTFVGLGCPRQEVWTYEFGENLSMPCIAVGAAFDFHAGFLRQAPKVLQDHGLEWLFRLTLEPRRLWRRYLLLNPLFIFQVALQKLRIRHYKLDDAKPPQQESLFG